MSGLKAFPNYHLMIETVDGTVLNITSPFTVTFNVKRNILSSPNEARIEIYNLEPKNRDAIYFDRYNIGVFKKIELKAGYGKDLGIIFSGNLREAYSYRSGTEMISHIDAWDNGFGYSNAFTNVTLASGTGTKETLEKLVSDIPNINAIKISSTNEKSARSEVLMGNSADLIKERLTSDQDFYVDNGQAYIIGKNETIRGDVDVISTESGLLDTPRKKEHMLEIKMLFEPKLKIGQLIELKSITAPRFNGQYKVASIEHRGTFSQNTSGENTTTINAWMGVGNFTTI